MFKNLIFIMFALLLSACGSSGVSVTTTFSNTQDVKEGSQVYLGDQLVGEVVDATVSNGQTQVEIVFEEEHAQLIDSNAAVVINRLKAGAPIEIYNRGTRSGSLQEGQSLTGLDSMFQLGAWMVGDAIKIGSSSVTEYVDSFQKYLQGDQFQQDKQLVEQQIESAEVIARETISAVNTEVNSALQELSNIDEPAAKALEQLGEELSPVVEELAKSGSMVIQELEKLTNSLEQAQETEIQAGENFLTSLLVVLEKLNNDVENGIDSANQSSETAQESKTAQATETAEETAKEVAPVQEEALTE